MVLDLESVEGDYELYKKLKENEKNIDTSEKQGYLAIKDYAKTIYFRGYLKSVQFHHALLKTIVPRASIPELFFQLNKYPEFSELVNDYNTNYIHDEEALDQKLSVKIYDISPRILSIQASLKFEKTQELEKALTQFHKEFPGMDLDVLNFKIVIGVLSSRLEIMATDVIRNEKSSKGTQHPRTLKRIKEVETDLFDSNVIYLRDRSESGWMKRYTWIFKKFINTESFKRNWEDYLISSNNEKRLSFSKTKFYFRRVFH